MFFSFFSGKHSDSIFRRAPHVRYIYGSLEKPEFVVEKKERSKRSKKVNLSADSFKLFYQ